MVDMGGNEDDPVAPKPVNIEIDGDAAVVTGTLGEAPTKIFLVRRPTGWKLDTFIGQPKAHALDWEDKLRDADFPSPSGSVRVRNQGGTGPCEEITPEHLAGFGDCMLTAEQGKVTIHVTTPFGRFEFGSCSASHRSAVDAQGRTWSTLAFTGGGGCGDVEPCLDAQQQELPWRGRIRVSPSKGFVQVVDACFKTCVGYFIGKLAVNIAPTSGRLGRWKVTSSVGDSGLFFTGEVPYDWRYLELQAVRG